MGRMHSRGKGISASALPYKRGPPSWLKILPTEVEENICKFAKKGLTLSQIGVILRDSHGIAQVKSVTGSKILRILKAHGMHKNRLPEYVQRSALSLPSYHTVNLGSQHEPKFKSTVWVDSIAYSSQTFLHKKDAEQNAAKVALETILKKIKDQGCPQIHEDLTYCKSILNEFATKRSLELPTYNTTMAEGAIIQLFVSTVVFHGKTYTGRPGRNKKEAEQLGAQSVIKSILGTEAGPFLCQIVNTKRKFYAALGKASDDNVFSVPSSENLPLKKPKLENVGGTSTGSVVDITPLVAQPQSDVHAEGINNPKKKNKRKGHRAMLVNGGVKPGALPLIQESACSVAQ